MAHIIYAHLRRGSGGDLKDLRRRVAVGAVRIRPVSNRVRETQVVCKSNVLAAIVNPPSGMVVDPNLIGVGHIAADSTFVKKVGGEPPEGTYAICRSDSQSIELLSDTVGSRTLWYYIDSDIFITSTSQRWIAASLGIYEPNDRVLTWMLATGTLGPLDAWDSRLKRLQANSTLTVDIESWTTTSRSFDSSFRSSHHNGSDQFDAFRAVIREAFSKLQFDTSKWALPLSGGYDSRAILCLLPQRQAIKTLTWGTAAAVNDLDSDAAVAARLAEAIGVPHEYMCIDPSSSSLLNIFERFAAHGEGRIDHISGYLDGFAVWRELLDRDVEGVIRGDEGFGWKAAATFIEARRSVGLILWTDYSNLPSLDSTGLPPQEIPEFLLARQSETPQQWRDRLYHQFRIPTMLSALTDLKAIFVEVANPLLTRSIIEAVRALPDDDRTDKALFKRVVGEISPPIPYAKTRAITRRGDVFRSPEAVEIFQDVLRSEAARSILPDSTLSFVEQRLEFPSENRVRALRMSARRWYRKAMARTARGEGAGAKLHADFNALAFRIYLICKSRELLTADARAGRAA